MVDFNPRYCEKCHYDLTGLKDIGRCPECGHLFNKKTGQGVTLSSDEQGKWQLVVKHFFSLSLLGVAVMLFIAAGISNRMGAGIKSVYTMLFLAGLLVTGAAIRYMNERW